MLKTIFLLFFFGITTIQAQTFKYGKVPVEQLEMVLYDEDSTAKGVVLFDVGEARFDYYNGSFKMSFKRHMRIKVLTENGLDLGDITIGYRTGDPEQEIKKIKATSYNLENGKIVKQSIGRRDRFKNKVSNSWSEMKFTIPNLQKGSVFEYEYVLESEDPIDFPSWYFQREIPVLFSRYDAKVPEWFDFLSVNKGFHPYTVRDQKRYVDKVVFQGGYGSTTVDYSGTEYNFEMKDVPAIIDEPYMKASVDYLSHIRFQLAMFNPPGDFSQRYLPSWSELVNILEEDEDFGKRLNDSELLKNAAIEVVTGISDDKEKMIAIYNHVSEIMEWNESLGIYAFSKLDETYSEGTGNGASINLILVQMLRNAGLNAHPIVLSTRFNGEIIDLFPVSGQFNHTIAYVEAGDTYYLLDAKNERRPYNLLPNSVVNDEGLLILKDEVIWVPIENNVQNSSLKIFNLALDERGIKGSLDITNKGFYEVYLRNELSSENIGEELKEIVFDIENGLEIDTTFIKKDALGESFEVSTQFSQERDFSSDIIYFNPMISDLIKENPFKIKERSYPVDYDYIFDENLFMNISLPDGWVVEEIPQSVIHKLPEGAGEFKRIIQARGNMISLNYRFRINKKRFTPYEYKELKEMYDKLVTTLAETMVIKKG